MSTDLPEPGWPSTSSGAWYASGELRYAARKLWTSPRVGSSFQNDSLPTPDGLNTEAT